MVNEGVNVLYANYPPVVGDYFDFEVEVVAGKGLRRLVHRQSRFLLGNQEPFTPLPYQHALPLLEWGLNWCVSQHAHQYLIIHAAVVEKNGRALILPGSPGAGKSTLCAALVSRGGWRLLSDELTLIEPSSSMIIPNPRPVSLKGASIDLISNFTENAVFSNTVKDTIKGTVAHLRPPRTSIEAMESSAIPGAIVFPQFCQEMEGSLLKPLEKGEALMHLIDQSFNYSILGEEGFDTLVTLLEASKVYSYKYSGDLHQAINDMDTLFS